MTEKLECKYAELWCQNCKMVFRDNELASCPFCTNRKPEILVRYVSY